MAQPVIEVIRELRSEDAHGEEQRPRMSYEQWLATNDEDVRSEWVDGEVIVLMSTTIRHGRIMLFLAGLLSPDARFFGLGEVLAETIEMKLPASARLPDIPFIANANLHRLSEKRLVGPADLVIDLVSDDSVERDTVVKFAQYAAAGVPEYWQLDARPGHEAARFFHLVEGAYVAALPDADGRYRSLVLPGFWFRPAWLWQEPLLTVVQCLDAIAPKVLGKRRRVPRPAKGQRPTVGRRPTVHRRQFGVGA